MTTFFDLKEATHKHLCRAALIKRESSGNFYPTEASAEHVDVEDDTERSVIVGKCIRAAYYRASKKFEDEKSETTPRREMIFMMGNTLESIMIQYFKQMGIWECDHIRIFDKERRISGELDVIIRDPTTRALIGVELKSYYGYTAEKQIEGNKSTRASPKIEHVLQAAIYLNHMQNYLKLPMQLFKIMYINRGMGRLKEFNLTLEPHQGQTYIAIDGKRKTDFSLDDVYRRYELLDQYLKADEVPSPDYALHFSPEEVELRRMKNKISDSAYKRYKQNPNKNPLGDWQCSYCDFKKVCWGV